MIRQLIALACASSAAADYVVDWRVPQANDANANAWVADVVVPAGEKVVLEWTDYFAFHNVYRMKDKAAYDACDFEGAVELAPSAATGSVTIDATVIGWICILHGGAALKQFYHELWDTFQILCRV